MRILRITISNLASLVGTHTIDLEGALANVGILPITGRTGAGKSTILDAMSVALYRQVARLPGVKSHGTAKNDLGMSVNDPRTLLREDAAEGSASVDFEGIDGRRYRATWSVRRARNRVGGNVQNDEWSIQDVETGATFGHKKGEIAAEIQKHVGLDYREFCQVMVLPQGRFAALLKAPAKERAELLERITGTEIYSLISKLAYERARDAKQAMQEIDRRIDGVALLSDTDRTSLSLRREALDSAKENLTLRLERQRDRKRQAERRAELVALVSRAQEEHDQAARDVASTQSTRADVLKVQRVRPLRPKFEAQQKVDARVERARRALAAYKNAERTAQLALDGANEERTRAIAAFDGAERSHQELRPALEQAASLDQEIALRGADLEAAQQAHAELARAAQQSDAEVARLTEARDAARQSHERLSEWLRDHSQDAQLEKVWAELKPQLQRLSELSVERKKTKSELRDARTQAQTQEQQVEAQTRGARVLADRIDALASELTQVAAESKELAPSVSTQTELSKTDADLLAAESDATEALRRAEALQAAEQEHSISSGRARGLRFRVAECQEREVRRRAQLDSADHLVTLAGNVASLEDRRAKLVAGEACPLCGATEHPYAAHAPAPMLGRLEAALDDARASHHAAVDALASSRTQREAADERLAEAIHGLSEARAAYAAAPSVADDPCQALERIKSRLAECRAALQANAPRLARLTELRAKESTLVAKREELRREKDEASAHEKSLSAELARLQTLMASAESRSAEIEHQLARLRSSVLECSPDLTELSEPEHILPSLEKRVLTLRAQSDAQRQQAEQLALANSSLEVCQAAQRGQSTQLAEAHHKLTELRSNHAALRERRNILLDGLSVADATARSENARKQHAASQQSATSAQVRSTAELEAARNQLSAAKSALAAVQAEAEDASAAVNETLATLELERAIAEELLAEWSDERIEQVRARLSELEQLARTAESKLAERRADLSGFAAAPATPESFDQAIERYEGAIATVEEDLTTTRLKLQRDDERQAEASQHTLERQAAAKNYEHAEALSGLIGSADGAALRTYAQGLTLELLVDRANQQLATLAPRLSLSRIGDVDLEVIDRDNANARRSVHSLSGGESFLVSLALALALGSLSSERVQVDSLFIDEGFGTLDSETLDVALAALESLHAQGRQIVLISHVQGLADSFATYVHVRQLAPGRSTIEMVGYTGPHTQLQAAV